MTQADKGQSEDAGRAAPSPGPRQPVGAMGTVVTAPRGGGRD